MFGNVISLEWKKQKSSFFSAWAILALCALALTIGFFLSPHGKSLGEVMDALLLGVIVGIPLYAILFGAMSGSGLRSDHRRASEEMLPFSPVARTFGAYAISLLLLVAFSSVPLLLGLSRNVVELHYPGIRFMLYTAISASVLLMHFLSFIFTYWVGMPILGGGLALLVTGICAFLWSRIEQLQLLFRDAPVFAVFPPMWLNFAATALAGAGALVFLAKKTEREVELGWKTIPVSLALSSSAILLLGTLFWESYQLKTVFKPIWSLYFRNFFVTQTEIPILHGALFQTASGNLLRVQAGGNRQLLLRGDELDALSATSGSPMPLRDCLIEADRITAALLVPAKNESDTYEVRIAGKDGTLESYSTFQSKDVAPDVIDRQDGALVLYGRSGKGIARAVVPAPGKPVQWTATTLFEGQSNYSYSGLNADRLRMMVARGQAAVFTNDGMALTLTSPAGQVLTWPLPEKANYPNIPILPAFENGGKPGFAVVLNENNGQRIVFCRPDGSVQDPWNQAWPGKDTLRPRVVPGGIRWMHGTWAHPEHLLIMRADGTAFPPIEINNLVQQSGVRVTKYPGDYLKVNVRRIDGDMMWVILQDSLVVVDLPTGKITKKLGDFPAGDSWRFVSPMNSVEGIYFVDGKRIRLMDWNGKVSDLGPARL